MKFISALRKYFALNAGQRDFISKGKRSFNMLPADMLQFLKPLASYDEELDGARAQLLNYFFLGFVLTIFAAILGGSEVIDDSLSTQIVLFMIAATITSILLRWFMSGFNLHNHLRNFVVPVVNSISQDMEQGKHMLVKLDLSGQLLKSKMVSCVNDNPGWFSYPKVTTSIFTDPWFSCSTQLVDGSNLEVSIEDTIRQRQITRKNARGKIKTKTKTKIKHKIIATLGLKNKTYALESTPSLQQSCDRLKIKDKPRRKAVTLINTKISTDLDADFAPQSCLDLIGKIFMGATNTPTKGS